VKGEKGKHAGIPVPDAISIASQHLILDIKAPTCGAKVGAGAAIDARKSRLFPERGFKHFS
jgi:hypothetical protein